MSFKQVKRVEQKNGVTERGNSSVKEFRDRWSTLEKLEDTQDYSRLYLQKDVDKWGRGDCRGKKLKDLIDCSKE